MIRRVIQLPKYDWSIVCFIGYQQSDADEICHALSDIGCNGNPLSEAYEHLTKQSADIGLTYSNLAQRRSVLAIGKGNTASIINTILLTDMRYHMKKFMTYCINYAAI